MTIDRMKLATSAAFQLQKRLCGEFPGVIATVYDDEENIPGIGVVTTDNNGESIRVAVSVKVESDDTIDIATQRFESASGLLIECLREVRDKAA